MKKIILLNIFYFLLGSAIAQSNTDSLAYQLQRKKINGMLARRAQKFGIYDESLRMHTGIFGLQTKKDIRRSNDILMDIVKTDNAIYRELKILLDYRMFQQTQVQTHSKEAEQSNIGFMMTINKLREQNDQLKASAEKQQQRQQSTLHTFVVIAVLLFAVILFLIFLNTRRRASR
ncbi:MAG: hypothetical protein JWP94_1258 [Mucilaginibacter sp.]|jgi:hypothetical protein|nr:hypothetical protein [Mucilaginibacter sp.]